MSKKKGTIIDYKSAKKAVYAKIDYDLHKRMSVSCAQDDKDIQDFIAQAIIEKLDREESK